MWLLPTLCYVVALLVSLSGIQYHIKLFKYPLYLSISLTLAVFIPTSIIFLLPMDYVSHNSTEKLSGFVIKDKVILYLWKTNYWVTFLLTWLLLPVLQEFYKSGSFNTFSKFKDALRSNIKYQIALLGVGILGSIYLVLEVGLSLSHLKLMVIALSHIYSLVLALWLMAHGLVGIPRRKWTEGSVMQDLNYHYLKVPNLVDDLEDTKITFKEEIYQVMVLEKNYTSNSAEDFRFRDWILQLYRKIPVELGEQVEKQYRSESVNAIPRDQITEPYMKNLTAKFELCYHKYVAYEAEFNTLFTKIISLEDILSAKNTSDLKERNRLNYRIDNHRSLLSPKLGFMVHYYILPTFNRLFSVLLFGLSFIIIESEFFHSTKLALINLLVYSTGIHNHSFLQLVVSSIIFLYVLFASLNSLTHLKIFNMYHLVPHKSDPSSACFYATYIARLTIPLSYNFITLFVSRTSVFESWFGESIHLTGLFNLMNDWLPRLVLIPVILTVFNVYDKLRNKLGLNSDFYDSWVDFDDGMQSGEPLNHTQNLDHKRKDLIIVEAKRIVSNEFFRRYGPNNLRHLNLADAANVNYENNRQKSFDAMTAFTSNRIDFNDEAQNNADSQIDSIFRSYVSPGVMSRLGGVVSGFRDSFSSRFMGRAEYRDDPISSGTYDDDADIQFV